VQAPVVLTRAQGRVADGARAEAGARGLELLSVGGQQTADQRLRPDGVAGGHGGQGLAALALEPRAAQPAGRRVVADVLRLGVRNGRVHQLPLAGLEGKGAALQGHHPARLEYGLHLVGVLGVLADEHRRA
jgi:hypothetical protein